MTGIKDYKNQSSIIAGLLILIGILIFNLLIHNSLTWDNLTGLIVIALLIGQSGMSLKLQHKIGMLEDEIRELEDDNNKWEDDRL